MCPKPNIAMDQLSLIIDQSPKQVVFDLTIYNALISIFYF